VLADLAEERHLHRIRLARAFGEEDDAAGGEQSRHGERHPVDEGIEPSRAVRDEPRPFPQLGRVREERGRVRVRAQAQQQQVEGDARDRPFVLVGGLRRRELAADAVHVGQPLEPVEQ